MRKLMLILLVTIFAIQLYAQDQNSNSNVKLFVSKYAIMQTNTTLDSIQCGRLYTKTQQLINQTGIAEIGYSTFLVAPKLEVVSVSVDKSGIGNVYLAECELSINIERRTINGYGGAVFNSFSKNVTGSGSTKAEAIRNAVSSIRSSDPVIVSFLINSKQKIAEYFKQHCNDVIKQAEQALALKEYELAISLYFSVPTNAPCYEEARQRSEGVYNKYQDDQCEKNLTKLKAYVAMGLNDEKKYDDVMATVNTLDPTAKCYAEAIKEINKLEARFTEQQKQAWEFLKKQAQNGADVDKERYKAMDRISKNYQPSPGNTIIIAH